MSSETPVKVTSCTLVYQHEFFKIGETCNICKELLKNPCSVCQSEGITQGCPIIYGECDHAFHRHCLLGSWDAVLKKLQPGDPIPKKTCPNCNTDEEFKEVVNADE